MLSQADLPIGWPVPGTGPLSPFTHVVGERMYMIRKLITGSAAAAVLAVVAATSAFAAGPAHAGPGGTARHDPSGTVPREGDVVGVGSDTDEFLLDQFSHDYNASHGGSAHLLYSWDALNPKTDLTDNIVTKSGCAAIQRPDGSSVGISALDLNAKTKDAKAFCIDYARSARGRSSSDPPDAQIYAELCKSFASQGEG